MMTTNRRRHVRLAIALPFLSLLAAACGNDDDQLVGYEIDPAPQLVQFSVDDASHDNAAFPLRAQPGQLLIMFLGFTNCPDACPTALTDVRLALERLGPDAGPIDVGMLTLDPDRDTPDVLTRYVQNFVDRAHALRAADTEHLQEIVDAFGATYAAEHDHTGATVDVGHTDYTYLLDDTGTVILTWTNEMTVDDITNDLTLQLDHL